MTLSWNQNASHTHETLITIELCDWSGPIWECSDGPEQISAEILFTNICRNTYLQQYVVASPGHGHSGVGPEQAANHLVHHPTGDCRWYWWRCELMMVMINAWKALKNILHNFSQSIDQVEMKCTIQYASDYPVIWMKLDSVDRCRPIPKPITMISREINTSTNKWAMGMLVF